MPHSDSRNAALFHFVAACTTWASTGCLSWSLLMWNWIGVREPSRSSMSLTPRSTSKIGQRRETMRIDAHQHFWRYEPHEYEWIDESMGVLRRDFLR